MTEPLVEVLPEGSCGALSFDSPPRLPQGTVIGGIPPATVLRAARRADLRLTVNSAQLCVVGLRVFDTYAELVAYEQGSPADTRAPWEAASSRWDIVRVQVTSDTGIRDAAGERGAVFRTVDGVVRSLPFRFGESDMLARLERTRILTLTAPLPKAVVGNWVFPRVAIVPGRIDLVADDHGLRVRLEDVFFPSDDTMIIGYSLEGSDAQTYLPRLEWTATDDLGTAYAARSYGRPSGPQRSFHYVALTPTSGVPARDRQLTLRAVRAFVPSDRTWSLTIELH